MNAHQIRLTRADLRPIKTDSFGTVQTGVVDAVLTVSDVMLDSGQSYELAANSLTSVVLLPLFGGVDVDNPGENFLGINQLKFLTVDAIPVRLYNPFANHTVNFLRIDFPGIRIVPFESNFKIDPKNTLVPIYRESSINLALGTFSCRQKATYNSSGSGSLVVAFAIGGAFEFEERLLEVRDMLVFKNAVDLTFEALSDNAVILILEISSVN